MKEFRMFFFRNDLSIGRRPAPPIKPPQGAYLSRVGTERCGNGFEFFELLNEVTYQVKR